MQLKNAFTIVSQFVAFICVLCSSPSPSPFVVVATHTHFFLSLFCHSLLALFCFRRQRKTSNKQKWRIAKENEKKKNEQIGNCLRGRGAWHRVCWGAGPATNLTTSLTIAGLQAILLVTKNSLKRNTLIHISRLLTKLETLNSVCRWLSA